MQQRGGNFAAMELRDKPTADLAPPPPSAGSVGDHASAMPRERIFHCTAGAAHKFWCVGVTAAGAGAVQTVRFGRIGTPGQTQNKPFACAAEATVATLRLIAAKRKKGYVEVTPETAAHAPTRKLPPRKRGERQLALPF